MGRALPAQRLKRTLTISTLWLSLGAMSSAQEGTAEDRIQQEYEIRKARIEQLIEKIESSVQASKGELERLLKDKAQVESEVQSARDEIKNLTDEKDRLEKPLILSRQSASRNAETIKSQEKELAQLKEASQDADENLKKAEQEIKALTGRITELTKSEKSHANNLLVAERMTAESKRLQKELDEAALLLKGSQAAVARLGVDLESRTSELEDARKQQSALGAQQNKSKAYADEAAGKIKSLEQALKDAKGEASFAAAERDAVNSASEKQSQKLRQVEKDLTDARQSIPALQKNITTLQDELNQANAFAAELDKARKELGHSEKTEQELEQKVETLTESLNAAQKEHDAETAALKEKVKKGTFSIATLLRENNLFAAEAAEKIKSAAVSQALLTEQVKQLNEQLRQAHDRSASLVKDVDRLAQDLNTSSKTSAELNQLRKDLEAAEQARASNADKLKTASDTIAKQEQEMVAVKNEAAKEASIASKKLDEAVTELAQARETFETFEGNATQLAEKVQALEAELQHSSKEAQELLRVRKDLDRAEKESRETLQKLEAAVTSAAASEKEVLSLKNRLKESAIQAVLLQEAEKKIADLQATAAESSNRLKDQAETEQVLARVKSELNAAEDARSQAIKELNIANDKVAAMDQLEKNYQQALSDIEEAQTNLSEKYLEQTNQQLMKPRDPMEPIEIAMKRIERENANLFRENQNLARQYKNLKKQRSASSAAIQKGINERRPESEDQLKKELAKLRSILTQASEEE